MKLKGKNGFFPCIFILSVENLVLVLLTKKLNNFTGWIKWKGQETREWFKGQGIMLSTNGLHFLFAGRY